MAAEQGRQAGTRGTDMTVQPVLIPGPSSNDTGRYSITAAGLSADTTVASSNHTQDTTSQLFNKPKMFQSSWSKRIFKTMLTLMLLLASVMKVEGNSDWRESPFNIQSPGRILP